MKLLALLLVYAPAVFSMELPIPRAELSPENDACYTMRLFKVLNAQCHGICTKCSAFHMRTSNRRELRPLMFEQLHARVICAFEDSDVMIVGSPSENYFVLVYEHHCVTVPDSKRSFEGIHFEAFK